MTNNRGRKILYTVLGFVAVIIVLVPFLWMILTSFKTPDDIFSIPARWLPKNPTFANYVSVWRDYPFKAYFANSLVVSLSTVLIVVIVSTLAAYGLARFKVRCTSTLEMLILSTQMIPVVVLVIPMFRIVRVFGLYDTRTGLILSYSAVTLPFCIWMLKGFVENIPKEIDLAAMIDGCTRFQAFRLVILPLMLPGIVATVVFAFLESWNLYLIPFVLTYSTKSVPLTVGIAGLVNEHKIDWGQIMAASTIAALPTLIVFLFFEKYLVANLTAGAIKQ